MLTEAEAQAQVDALIAQATEQIDTLSIDEGDHALFQQLVEGFSDKRGMTRLRIAETLGQIGEPAVPAVSAAMLSHPDPVVRRACAKTLTLISDPDAIPDLIHAALYDEDTVVRGSAVGALARTGEAAVPELVRILAAPETPDSTKGLAAWALAFIGAEAKTLLYQALDTDNETVRAAVVGAIAKVAQDDPKPDNFAILINALTDPAADVRSEAAAALGNLAYAPARPALVQQLQHAVPETRKAAALALMKIGDPAAIAPLQAAQSAETEDSLQPIYRLALNQLQRPSPGN